MHQKLIEFNQKLRAVRTDIPALQAGDVVKVRRRIIEGEKTRVQMFQGMVIALKGGQSSSQMVTVRKVTAGIGVEIIFPLLSSQVESIELIKRTKARRGKLYFVRSKSAKVIGKKLKEVPFAVGRSGQAVKDVVNEASQADTNEVDADMSRAISPQVEEKSV